MQPATPDTVLGDFDNATFEYAGTTTRFFREGDRFMVRTDNPEGELETYAVEYVFGVYPLQQLLLPLPGGRLQALTIAWDARPEAEGGQRWYHLFPGQNIRAGDPLHWTGIYHNWNNRCAECHSTDVHKGYEADQDRYNTRFEAVDVGCEACHGPGGQHVSLAASGQLANARWGGFPVNLRAAGQWQRASGEPVAQRSAPADNNGHLDTCGRCHARRSTLGEYHHGADLLDTHRLATLDHPLYWPDGQIRDEVYVLGSFLQSAMHQAGVVCSNCHNPHSGALVAQGNALCGQCHAPDTYDTAQHHHHQSKVGSACVNCHMPATTYMGVDARRDHSLRVPRPDISLETGAPNACQQCHEERSADWALNAMHDWGTSLEIGPRTAARAFHAADRADIRSVPTLKSIAASAENPAIQRASAAARLGQFSLPDSVQVIAPLLRADDALLRASAVRAVPPLPPVRRYLLLRPLIKDPVLDVRMAVAEQLADLPLAEMREQDRPALTALFNEYRSTQRKHSDMPSVRVQLASFELRQGNTDAAEQHLRQAIQLNPQLEPAVLNLADLMRSTGRDNEARKLLSEGVARTADAAGLKHALGLLEIRAGQREQGLEWLKAAVETQPDNSRYRYVYAVALYDSGKTEAALKLLSETNRAFPGQPEILNALISYHARAGDSATARRYQDEARRVFTAAGLN
jgi:predicted CXXCH cytochrome family protein